jgi:hypothetical protein
VKVVGFFVGGFAFTLAAHAVTQDLRLAALAGRSFIFTLWRAL